MSASEQAARETLLKITQVRSRSGRPAKHRATLEALGLRRHQQTVVQPDNPAIRGMLFQVRHLVEVSELSETGEDRTKRDRLLHPGEE